MASKLASCFLKALLPYRRRSAPLAFISTLLLVPAATASSATVGDAFFLGQSVSGSVSYTTISPPQDSIPDDHIGYYDLRNAPSRISIDIGSYQFSSSRDALFQVRTANVPSFDEIQFLSYGDNESFSGFLSNFARQNAALDPIGLLLINFFFPSTYFATDGFPTTFSPKDAVTIQGQIDGVSTQKKQVGIREWALFFNVAPSDTRVRTEDGLLTVDFAGVLGEIDDRTEVGTPIAAPVPLPAAVWLLLVSLASLSLVSRIERHRIWRFR